MPASRRKSEEMPGPIAVARSLRGWTQAQLAKASGLAATSISDYERGERTPTYRSLQRIAAALGVSVPDLLALASVARRFRASETPPGGVETGGDPPGDLPDLRPQLVALLRAEVEPAAGAAHQARRAELDAARRRAPALWDRVEPLAGPARRALVLRDSEFHDAAFCELICDQSVEAAGDSAERALELAELALLAARRVPGTEGWRSRLEGYCQAHVAGALLVGSHLTRADRTMDAAGQLWRAGAADDPGLLNESRVLALEARLRRAQRHLPEAQALLDQALAIDCWGETPSLLIAAARAVEETGDFDQAIALLARAAAHLDAERDPRRLFLVRKNTAVNLCHLGRHADAQRLLPQLRSTASVLDQDLEIVRLQWLEARVAAGLGDPADALAALALVRSRFIDLDLAYDAALVTLELAEIHVQLGHPAEVTTLARESVPIFHAQGVHREARMALDLFRQAAEREAATADLLRRLIVYLYRARRDPQLRFAPSP